MKLFRDDNTEGYTASELLALNNEFDVLIKEQQIDEYTDEYDDKAKQFCDEVSRR